MRLRQLFEAPGKTAAFAFGRLNPATNGHELLVQEIVKQPGDAFLFLSDRPAKLPTDPLSAEEKLEWAQKSFNNISVGLAKTALIAADRLYKMGYTNLIYLEGEAKMGTVIKKYNGVEAPLHNYNFDNIDLVRLERDPDDPGARGMSATKLRQSVIDKDFDAFQAGITQAAQPYAEDMFKKLQELLAVREAKEATTSAEIYVDMDGVLADFFGEWAKLMNVDHFTKINKQHNIDDALQKIRDTDDFWLRLPLLPQAKNLLNMIKQVKGSYNICSSPLADDPNSEKHKRTWVKKNLSFFPPKNVYITHNKPQYATQKNGTPNILIDDYGVNIDKWEAAGGVGFKHKDHKFERTAKNLKQNLPEDIERIFNKLNEAYKVGHDTIIPQPKLTLVIDTPGDLDWYKLGTHYPTLAQQDPREYGQEDSDTVMTFSTPAEMSHMKRMLDRMGAKYKEIGGTHQHPEVHQPKK